MWKNISLMELLWFYQMIIITIAMVFCSPDASPLRRAASGIFLVFCWILVQWLVRTIGSRSLDRQALIIIFIGYTAVLILFFYRPYPDWYNPPSTVDTGYFLGIWLMWSTLFLPQGTVKPEKREKTVEKKLGSGSVAP